MLYTSIAYESGNKPEKSQNNSEINSTLYSDEALGMVNHAQLRTEILPGNYKRETIAAWKKKQWTTELSSDAASMRRGARSDRVGPTWNTRKSRARKTKNYNWGHGGKSHIIFGTLNQFTLKDFMEHHPEKIEGVLTDKQISDLFTASIRSLNRLLESNGLVNRGHQRVIEYSKDGMAHIHFIMDISYADNLKFSSRAKIKNLIREFYQGLFIPKDCPVLKAHMAKGKSKAQAISNSACISVVGEKYADIPVSKQIIATIDYLHKTGKSVKEGKQQNPPDNCDIPHVGVSIGQSFKGLQDNQSLELVDYDVVHKTSDVLERTGWECHRNSDNNVVLTRTVKMQPHEPGYDSDFKEHLEEPEVHTEEPAEPASEPSKSSPRVNTYKELAGTPETPLWPNKTQSEPVSHRTMVQAMKASLQYMMLGTGGHKESLHPLYQLALTAPAAHPANPLLLTAAHHAAAVSPSLMHTAPAAHAAVLQRPRGHRGEPVEEEEPP